MLATGQLFFVTAVHTIELGVSFGLRLERIVDKTQERWRCGVADDRWSMAPYKCLIILQNINNKKKNKPCS